MDTLPTELWERICGRLADSRSVCNFRLTCRTGAYVGKKYLLHQQLVGFSQGSFDRALATTKHPQLGWLGQRTDTLIIDPHDLEGVREDVWKREHHLKSCSHCQGFMKAAGFTAHLQWLHCRSLIRDQRCPMPSSELEELSLKWDDYRDEIRQSQDAELPKRMVLQEQIPRLFAALPKIKHVIFAANGDLTEQSLRRSPGWPSRKQCLRGRRFSQYERNKHFAFLDLLHGLERTETRLQSLTILDAPLEALLRNCHYRLPHSECLQSVRIKFAGVMARCDIQGPLAAMRLSGGYICQICNITHTRHHLAESLGKATGLQELTIAVQLRERGPSRLVKLPIIVAENHWPKLKRLSLAGFQATEGQLKNLLLRHKDSLETLELCDAYLTDGTWDSLFTSIAGRLPKLRRFKLYQSLWSKATRKTARQLQEYQSCRNSLQRSARGMELERRLQEYLITGDHLFPDLVEGFRRGVIAREYLSGRRTWESQGPDLEPDVDRDIWDLKIER